MRRFVVWALATADELVDEVLYRPAIVRAFRWLPRWWRCDLARLSMALDDRWRLRWWRDEGGAEPGGVCEACGRRAAWLEFGGPWAEGDEDDEDEDDACPGGGERRVSWLDDHTVHVCGWCTGAGDGALFTEEEVRRNLAQAGAASVAWRWRPGPAD
jgi:hypothetical protein